MFTKGRKVQEGKSVLPRGGLESTDIQMQLTVHHGIPSTASKLAFEPVQRLLAVSTLDGKIKLIGNDGIQGILVADTHARCKFLEFANNLGYLISISVENDIQVWDLEKGLLAESHQWLTNITAFSVVQGSSFMYIGEDSGNVAVLEYESGEQKLRQMPYEISLHATMGTLVEKPSSDNPPSVLGILPFPGSEHRRVLIAYSNGLIIVWGVYESEVLRARGAGALKNDLSIEGPSFDMSDDEGKDICSFCWADSIGNLLAVGYTDGDILFWDFSIMSNGQNLESSARVSNIPLLKFQTSSSMYRLPLAMCWSAANGKEGSGVNGHVYIYGAGENYSKIMILSLTSASENPHAESHLELSLTGSFEDMLLLPRAGGTPNDPAAYILMLTSSGQLHAYDQASITKCLLENGVLSSADAVPLRAFPTDINVTAVKIALLPKGGKISEVLSQLPRNFKGNMPPFLPGGTKWPITGGFIDKSVLEKTGVQMILITGHVDGSLNIWDCSTSLLCHLCCLSRSKELWESAPISHLELCSHNGILVVAQNNGVVLIYAINAEACEVQCCILDKTTVEDQLIYQDAGFQCTLVISLEESQVSTVAVSDDPVHIGVGYTNGVVLWLDAISNSIFFHDVVFSHEAAPVVSLAFTASLSTLEKSDQIVSAEVSSDSPLQSKRLLQRVLYALAKDSSIVGILFDTKKASTFQPCHLDKPSKVVHLSYLELSFEEKDPNELKAEDCGEELTDESNATTGAQEPTLLSSYYVLCTENSVYLYSNSTSDPINLTCVNEVKSSFSCCWASTFLSEAANVAGLVLLDDSGRMQIRSIPDLDVVKEISLAKLFDWQAKSASNPPFIAAHNGLMAIVDPNKELIIFTFLSIKHMLRNLESPICFFDKDLAAAADAALQAASRQTQRKSQIQEFVGVLKDLKGGFLKEIGGLMKNTKAAKDLSIQTNVPSTTLSDLFSKRSTNPQLDRTSEPNSPQAATVELDIDDIHIDDEKLTSKPSNPKSPAGERLPTSQKGKEIQSDSLDDRAKLLGEEGDVSKPQRRTAEEIKAKYGYVSKRDVSGVAGMARDKLLERQEKLEALSKRTQEMQEGAENFASMAAELAKAMEGRKWWQI